MRILSVAERELRAAARQPATHRLRWLTAAAFLALLVWMMWIFRNASRQTAGLQLFQAMTVIAFIHSLFVGTARTADCLSSERREGTLGLLFLTNLNSVEIVAGKFCSHALATLYALLAIFPILALPLLMGGVAIDHFWRTVLALVNVMCFALACGFVASVVSQRQYLAVGLALGMAIAGVGVPLGLAELPGPYAFPKPWAEWLPCASPMYPMMVAKQTAAAWGQNRYWVSLALTQALSWLALGLVAWRLSYIWRDRPTSAPFWKRWRIWPRLRARTNAGDIAFRRRLLAINPFFWLGSRQRVSAPVFMIAAVVLMWVAVKLAAPAIGRSMGAGAIAPLAGFVIAWLFLGMTLHGLLLYYAAMVASQRLAEDKQTGALELILSTPTTERIISRGLWLAYGRRLFPPALTAVLVHLFFLWAGASAFLLDGPGTLPPGLTAGQLLWAVFWNEPVNGVRLDWQFGFILRIFLFALVLLMVHWVTLGWVGRWLGLRMKHPGFAPVVALVAVMLPPWVVFSVVCYAFDEWGWMRMPERQLLPLMLWVAFLLPLLHCGLMSWWAASRLRHEFRNTVMSRFQPPRPRRWLPRPRTVLRFALGSAAVLLLLALLVAGFYGYQNWRSRRAWAGFQTELQRRGESLALAPCLPGAVPAEQNLVQTRAFQVLLERRGADASLPKQQFSRLQKIIQESGYYGQPLLSVIWPQQKPSDLAEATRLLQTTAAKLGETNRPAQAEALLQALLPFDALMIDMADGAGRPFFLDSTNRAASAVFHENEPALRVLEQAQYLFLLRASARLALNRAAAAAEDLLTSLRLAGLGRQSPDRKASTRVQVMAARSLQPLWEGLVEHRWNEAQLADFQAQLAGFNLLADHTNAIHRYVLAQIEVWQQNGPEQGRPPVVPGSMVVRSGRQSALPRGWWLNQSIQLYEGARKRMARVDPGNGRMMRDDDWSDFSGIDLDGDAYQLLQQQSVWWGANPACLAYAQTIVNQGILACALERYRLARGAYPETAEALVPEFLKVIPTDVVRGRPLIYQRIEDDRYLLRGVGPDEKDDRVSKSADDWLWQFPTNAPAGAR